MPFILRQLLCEPKGKAPGNDSDLVDRIGAREEFCHQCMPCFMVSGYTFFLIRDNHALSLSTHEHLVFGLFKIEHIYSFFVSSGCQQGCLVYKIFKIGARKTRCTPGNYPQIDIRAKRNAMDMHLQDLLTPCHIRHRDHYLPIETTGP